MSLRFLDGVIPAITTPFNADDSIDHGFLAEHTAHLMQSGCSGIVALGSLGETSTLNFSEKRAVLRTIAKAAGPQRCVVAGIAALSTSDAVALARDAAAAGCAALMVLPAYAYSTDEHEMEAHVSAVIAATDLPCVLYNNPIAYKTDFKPQRVEALCAQHGNLKAIKESSADIRRVTELRRLMGERLRILMGVDDLIVEGIAAGATGWIAGLCDAFPHESVRLFDLARAGRWAEAQRLYDWFLPLLRLDTVPKFVQLIKLTQEMVGQGSARVRAPRLPLVGDELAQAQAVIQRAIDGRLTLD